MLVAVDMLISWKNLSYPPKTDDDIHAYDHGIMQVINPGLLSEIIYTYECPSLVLQEMSSIS